MRIAVDSAVLEGEGSGNEDEEEFKGKVLM
jgi:hypothetical protein